MHLSQPPIIFAAGFEMKARHFLKQLQPILLFSVVGTIISCVVFGSLLWAASEAGWILKFTAAEAFTFGALLSATDPVSTLAIFSKLHVEPKMVCLFSIASLSP